METYQIDHNSIHLGNRMNEARDKLLVSIDEVLSFSDVVLNFLEMNTGFNRNTILEDPEVFCNELEDLFGAGARGIEDLIVERFYGKMNMKYARVRGKSFVDYINEAINAYVD